MHAPMTIPAHHSAATAIRRTARSPRPKASPPPGPIGPQPKAGGRMGAGRCALILHARRSVTVVRTMPLFGRGFSAVYKGGCAGFSQSSCRSAVTKSRLGRPVSSWSSNRTVYSGG